jgi:hypothetical protein
MSQGSIFAPLEQSSTRPPNLDSHCEYLLDAALAFFRLLPVGPKAWQVSQFVIFGLFSFK